MTWKGVNHEDLGEECPVAEGTEDVYRGSNMDGSAWLL